MDLLKSLNKATGGGNDSENHAQGHHQQKQQSSNTELLSSAKLVAEAAKSSFGGESHKVDKAKVAGAGADLLDAASKYGKLEEKSFGKYVDKAEDYLHNYKNTHSSTTTGGGVPGHGHLASAPQTGHTTHSAPSHEGGGGGGGGGGSVHLHGGDGDSGNKYGEYFNAAKGFLKKH